MFSKSLFVLAGLACLTPWASSAGALALGVALALTMGNPFLGQTRKWAPLLLQWSVIGLGAAMDLNAVIRVGAHGFGYTALGISLTLAAGTALGRWLRVERGTSILVSSGTAICGGSAIAAVSAAIRARQEEISVALGTVFVLNALGLVVFPPIGHALGMTQDQFGLWSALAIHDTSSVVGASLAYGPRALEVATTVKLARALWIIPLTVLFSWLENRRSGAEGVAKAKRPWFILGFVLAAAMVTWVPALRPAGHAVSSVAKQSLVLVLFLIGSGLTQATLRAVGARPFVQGVLLWVLAACASAAAILALSG